VTLGNALVKFADDTYLVIPACNVDTRPAELENVEMWARENNEALNRAKSTETIFVDKKRRREVQQPPELPGITRTTSLKVLGITIMNKLTVSEHVRGVISSCAQTLYALRVLRAHGMCDAALQAVYRSVVVAKLMYASSAWWGFTNSVDRQRIDSFIRRSVRCGYCAVDLPAFSELCDETDKKLFDSVNNNPDHVLHYLLPPPTVASQNYQLRPRRHNRRLPERTSHIIDCNFLDRMLFTDIY